MKTPTDFLKMKRDSKKIASITSYDYPSAKLAEQAGVDFILVGDSLGMVALGYDSTCPVTLSEMIHHGKAARRGAPNTFLMIDMPFMTYHGSMDRTIENARQLFQSCNAQALKLEGADQVVEKIETLTKGGIPVVSHLGLTPQTVSITGNYKVQAKEADAVKKLIDQAKHVEKAGAIMLVLEAIPRELAKLISEELAIPTIGIGAGLDCDGQILVFHDMMRYGVDRSPKFAKVYANAGTQIQSAIKSYVEEVKDKTFPDAKHSFAASSDLVLELYGGKK